MGSFGYINPYSFGGHIIAMTGSGISTADGGGPPWKDQNHYDITRSYYSRGPGSLSDYNATGTGAAALGNPQFWHEEGNVMTGYLARIDGGVGACSVRYRTLVNSLYGGTYYQPTFAQNKGELLCDGTKGEGGGTDCPESAEAGLHYDGVTGHIHWENGDTGIKHFTVQTHVVVDYVTEDLACVVRIDKPTGCHLKVRYTDHDLEDMRKDHCDYSTVFTGVLSPTTRFPSYQISGEDGVDHIHTKYHTHPTAWDLPQLPARYPHIDFTFIIRETQDAGLDEG